MEFQLLDCDYVLVNEKPIIRMFGKTTEGKSVCVFYDKFLPYFYAEGDYESVLGDEPLIVKTEKVTRKLVLDEKDTAELTKITIQNPAKTPELRQKLIDGGVRVFEADILFRYRFLNDMSINGCNWIQADVNTTPTETVNVDLKAQAKSLKPLKKVEDVELKVLAFDIECVSTTGEVPDPKRDSVIMIAFSLNQPYKGKKKLVISTRPDPEITSLSNEKEMLEEFNKIVTEYDPDVITGFNVNNFDLPFVIERMKQNKIRPMFGRCRQKQVTSRAFAGRTKNTIIGRVVVDSYELVKKDFSLKRYNLNSVAEALLGEKKVDVKHSEISTLWTGPAEGYKKLIDYNIQDAVLALNLVQKLNMTDKYVALSKVSGTLLQDTLNSGETTRIENFLLRRFNREGFVFPNRPSESDIEKRQESRKVELKGGFVLEPIKGLHKNVVVLDFKSMYPSIIRGYNICPTTLIRGENKRDDLIVAATGARFLPKTERRGIMPAVLEELMNRRGAVKKKLKLEDDFYKKRAYHAEQWALKILANAFYGHMGYSRAKIYNLEIANAITGTGRSIIQQTKDIVEKEYKLVVAYGDTDSVMVKVEPDDLEEIRKIAEKIAADITQKLPDCIELEFEKTFKRFLPLTKKRYVAWKFELGKDGWKDGLEMKGVETVRRDWCELVSDTMRTLIEILLKKDDVKGAVKHFNSVIEDLNKGKISIDKLVITKGMTKQPKKYNGMQPHVELVKKLQKRHPGEAPGIGDRIGYVIVKGIGLLSERAEDPAYVTEKGLSIDPKYYTENQLLPPAERIFGSLKISKSELLGNGKQMGIFDAVKHQQAKEEPPLELPFSDTNGFICTKCNKAHNRPPLVGMCECGGAIGFSSPKGIATTVTVN